MRAWLGSVLSGLQTAALLLCPHMMGRGLKSLPLFIKALIPSLHDLIYT